MKYNLDTMRHAFKSLVLLIAFTAISGQCVAQDFNKLVKELVSTNPAIWNKAHKKSYGVDSKSKILLINLLMKEISTQKNIKSRQAGIIAVGDITLDLPIAMQSKRVIPFLSKILILEGSREDSNAAKTALIKIGKPAIPYLMSLMRHTGSLRHAGEREKVLSLVETHVQNNNKEIIAELVNYLDDDIELGRHGVLLVLSKLKASHSKYVPKLIEVYHEPRNKMLRAEIALIFSNMGFSAVAAAPSLIEGLQVKEDEYLRHVSAIALGKFGKSYPDSIPVLIKALHDPSCDVRTSAMESLKNIGGKQALSAVKIYKENKRFCKPTDI